MNTESSSPISNGEPPKELSIESLDSPSSEKYELSEQNRDFIESHFPQSEWCHIPVEQIAKVIDVTREKIGEPDDELLAELMRENVSSMVQDHYFTPLSMAEEQFGIDGRKEFENQLLKIDNETLLKSMAGEAQAVEVVKNHFDKTKFKGSEAVNKFISPEDFYDYEMRTSPTVFELEDSTKVEAVETKLETVIKVLEELFNGPRTKAQILKIQQLLNKIKKGEVLLPWDKWFANKMLQTAHITI